MIGNKTAKAIANNSTWNQLKVLDLSDNQITDEGARAFGCHVAFVNLTNMGLSGNPISDEVAFYIRSNPVWKHSIQLNLPERILDQVFSPYLRGWSLESVIDLDLANIRFNRAQDLIADRIALNWRNMSKLNLSNCDLSDESGSKISSNTAWRNLRELNLSKNQMVIRVLLL